MLHDDRVYSRLSCFPNQHFHFSVSRLSGYRTASVFYNVPTVKDLRTFACSGGSTFLHWNRLLSLAKETHKKHAKPKCSKQAADLQTSNQSLPLGFYGIRALIRVCYRSDNVGSTVCYRFSTIIHPRHSWDHFAGLAVAHLCIFIYICFRDREHVPVIERRHQGFRRPIYGLLSTTTLT